MRAGLRAVSPILFGFVLLCMFLPFASVSCQGRNMATVSAAQLAAGTTISADQTNLPVPAAAIPALRNGRVHIDSEPRAVALAIFAVLGLAVGLLRLPARELLASFAAVAGLVALVLLKVKIDREVVLQAPLVFDVEYRAGFYLILALLAGALVLNVFIVAFRRTTPEPSAATASGPPGTAPP